MYQDTVVEEKLLRKPKFIAALFVICFIVLFYLNLTNTLFGQMLSPAIGEPESSGVVGQFVVSITLAMIIVGGILAISFLKYKHQVITVWLLLFFGMISFFYTFNLSMEFIKSKIWFMVSQGIVTTLYVSALSIFFAFILALLGAIAKLSSNGFANGIAQFYTSFFRGLPLLMQVYLIYLGLPQLGIVIDAVPAGVIALSLCYGAYMTEIFRAGIMSIPKGQWEGARSLGFSFSTTMKKVVLPQAIPLIIPSTGNQFIAMLKDSSLVSVIGVWELMFLARTLGQSEFKHMEMLITAAMIYWGLSMILELIQSRIEKHYQKRR